MQPSSSRPCSVSHAPPAATSTPEMVSLDATTADSPSSDPPSRRRNRICLVTSLCLLATVIVLGLTVFKVRNPVITFEHVGVTGVAPQANMLSMEFGVNVTLGILFSVKNPNYASFRHFPGTAEVEYRNLTVGDADVAEGRIPPRGSEAVSVILRLRSGNFTADLVGLTEDILSGRMEFSTYSRVPGRVLVLGFITMGMVATSTCKIVLGFPDMGVLREDCVNTSRL